VRQLITTLSAKYGGRVLLVHNQQHAARNIIWYGNLGTLGSDVSWSKIGVDTARPTLFYIAEHK